MVDTIGRHPIGRTNMIGIKKRNFLEKTIQKMEQWRDKARINLFQQRERYKLKVKSNQALMRAKKADRTPNLNPGAALVGLGDKPKSRKFGVTHSTIPAKPKYSMVKPAKRIYGNLWKKLERDDKE
ncbi:MAG: hypothetical protein Q7J35_15400 [Candidatus Methanoperedens sp.]|nr:hypothetical protein [Candidatus Methanoperedens sp.]